MKRFLLFFFISSLFSALIYAQDSVLVHQGAIIYKYLLSDIDSITHNKNNSVNIYCNSQNNGYSVTVVDSISLIHHNTSLGNMEGEIDLADIDIYNYLNGCKVICISDLVELNGSKFNIKVNTNEETQTFFVIDSNYNVFLAARSQYANKLKIDIESTALALVTLHPLFAPLKGEEYLFVLGLIKNSPLYNSYYKEIEKTIKARRNLFDLNNEDLLLSFSNLMEDICSANDTINYSDSLSLLPNYVNSKAIRRISPNERPNNQIDYFDVDINGNTLVLRNRGITPSYYGTVTRADGTIDDYSVRSRSDYGVLDLFKNINHLDELNLGPQSPYTFNQEGEYRFYLSRTNEAATLDFYMRIAGSILSALGLRIGGENVEEIGQCIANAIATAGSNVIGTAGNDSGEMEFMDWFGIALEATKDYLCREGSYLAERNMWTQVRNFAQFFNGRLFQFYNIAKGAANATARITYALNAPENIEFCLCYYQGEIKACSQASLSIINGNDQTGYPKQRLLLPLRVKVQTYGDDGFHDEPSNYHKVMFEVVSGGGFCRDTYVSTDNNSVAETYWHLGDDGEQIVKAIVVDIITNKPVSNPVYFKATLDYADITIRLDWNKLSGNTDVDLHVVDPFGEEIYYQHMHSESGGWLDRDDVVGPGPEHIRWTNAPAGIYKIYVVFYHSDFGSITQYRVKVHANGVDYPPVSNSIMYYQDRPKIPVGYFTISDNSAKSAKYINADNISLSLEKIVEDTLQYDLGVKDY